MLVTGHRLYLEMEAANAEGERAADLEITNLPADQRYPDELEKAAWYRPDHINWHLGLVRRFVH